MARRDRQRERNRVYRKKKRAEREAVLHNCAGHDARVGESPPKPPTSREPDTGEVVPERIEHSFIVSTHTLGCNVFDLECAVDSPVKAFWPSNASTPIRGDPSGLEAAKRYAEEVERCFGELNDEFDVTTASILDHSATVSPPGDRTSSSSSSSSSASRSSTSTPSSSSSSSPSSTSSTSTPSSSSSSSPSSTSSSSTSASSSSDASASENEGEGENPPPEGQEPATDAPPPPQPWETDPTIRRPFAPTRFDPACKPATAQVRPRRPLPRFSRNVNLEALSKVTREILTKKGREKPKTILEYTTNDDPSRRRKRKRRVRQK